MTANRKPGQKRGRCHTPSATAVARFHAATIEATRVTDRARFAANPAVTVWVRPAGRHEFCIPSGGRCLPLVEVPPGAVLLTRVESLAPGIWSRRPIVVDQADAAAATS